MKLRSSVLLALLIHVSAFALASPVQNKRTILTSGEAVYPIRYKLGQSTVLFFGFKPETVICGNKNYFNIEKIKDGVTVQPLSNFSTNLIVINGKQRFLFYLTPAGNSSPDGFVEVKWIPGALTAPVIKSSKASEVVKPLTQSAKLPGNLELQLLQQKTLGKRQIIEFQLKNLSKDKVKTNAIELVVIQKDLPLTNQVKVLEVEELKPQASARGRLIFIDESQKNVSLLVGFRQRTIKLMLRSQN